MSSGIGGVGGAGNPIRMPSEIPDLEGLGKSVQIPTTETEQSGFVNTFNDYLKGVNDLQNNSQDTFRAFIRGEAELHDVAIASHEAGIAMQLTSEIRNKLLMAYQEIMRMPM